MIKRAGLPKHVVLAAWGISAGTLERARVAHRRLSSNASGRAMHLELVMQTADALFGFRRFTALWMLSSVPALGNHRPVDFVTTSSGTTAVLDFLGGIEVGLPA